MIEARVLKWTVPVDDHPHMIGVGKVLLVDCQYNARSVQVWTEEVEDIEPERAVIIYAIGQPHPFGLKHIGSACFHSLVWHVFELSNTASAGAEE